jgi:HAMP domain-containing protein
MRLSIKARITAAVLGCMLGLAVTAGVLLELAARRATRIASEQAMASASATLAALERADVEQLDTALVTLMAHPGLASAFAARDRERLRALAEPIFAELEKHAVTHWYFVDPEPARTYFLRVHRPERFGDVVASETLSAAIASRGRGAGMELGKTAFALRVVRPFVAGGKALGYMALGEEIDSFLERMRAQTGDDYGLLVEKRFLDRRAWASSTAGRRDSWDDLPDAVVVSATAAAPPIVDAGVKLESVPDSGLLLDERERGGRSFVRGIVPVTDAAGRRVGALFVQHDTTALRSSMTRVRTAILCAAAAAAVLLAALLVWLAQRLVFARLARMTATMEDLMARLAGGDYDVARDMKPSGADEIGRFEGFFGQFLVVIEGVLKVLTGQRAG